MGESVELPLHILPDGREFITGIDLVERPEVRAFVERFPKYWKTAPELDGVVGPTPQERQKLLQSAHYRRAAL